MNMKRKIAATLSAIALVTGIGIGVAPAANAANAWVYVVVNNGVCGTPGTVVRGILATDVQSGWTTTRWDNGDNIIYPQVRLGTKNQIIIQARCERRVGPVWQAVGFRTLTVYILPQRQGQTFQVG